MASMVFGKGNITERKAYRTDYDAGFNAFTSQEQYNSLWSKRKQEGWRSAFRKEVAFGNAMIADGKKATGSINRLAVMGITFAA